MPKLPSISLYKRIAIVFICLTLVLVLSVGYFSLGSAIIKVYVEKQDYKVDFFINIGQKTSATEVIDNFIGGKILKTTVENVKTFSTTGKKKSESTSRIVGKIKVKNDSDRDYNFVAKTRFLSKDGILFRMQSPTKIPAQEEVEVEVYQDDDNFTGALAPTTFTVPGLSIATQKLVYGTTDKALVAGGGEFYYLTEEDVQDARQVLTSQLKTKALLELRDQLKFREKIFESGTQLNIIEEKIDPATGDMAEDFNLSLKVEVVSVSLNEKELADEIKLKIIKQLPSGLELSNFNPDKIVYSLEKYDALGDVITFKVSYNGTTIITNDNDIFNKENFIGLTKQEVNNSLFDFDGVKSVDVKLLPFWVGRIPNIVDSVDVVLVK